MQFSVHQAHLLHRAELRPAAHPRYYGLHVATQTATRTGRRATAGTQMATVDRDGHQQQCLSQVYTVISQIIRKSKIVELTVITKVVFGHTFEFEALAVNFEYTSKLGQFKFSFVG